MGCDPKLEHRRVFADNLLFFSHGRAAMIWLITQLGPFQSAAVCAYTWPEIPRMLKRYGLEVGFFDMGQENIDGLVSSLPGRCLVIVPVFYGFKPWIDYQAVAKRLSAKAFVLLDAAQSAFGFEDYPVAPNVMVLSCPHKATALNDGAMLAFEQLSGQLRRQQEALEPADEFRRVKEQGRLLLASSDDHQEQEGLRQVAKLEETWISDPPQRMTDQSKNELAYLDAAAHKRIRRANYQQLQQRLKKFLPPLDLEMGVPFAYAAVTADRESILKKLYARRIFATALWHNAIYDPGLHPKAADYARRLIALPVDQRYDQKDMDEMADHVVACL